MLNIDQISFVDKIISNTLSLSTPDCVRQLLKLEAKAINQTSNKLDKDQIAQSLEILDNSLGKVITIGVGKSGIIARKIASTFTSIGAPAVFLHPSDALHGDFGIVTQDDVVIMLTNSGETDELLAIIPYLKKRFVPIIGIIGNIQSSIAKKIDVVLDASVDCEVCPLNLAPTTSTTVALAIGDSIAMTIAQRKGLTQSTFASNHPAGRLGKRLNLQVVDLMYSNDNYPKLLANARWTDIVCALTHNCLGAVSIIASDERLLGIITDGDLRRSMLKTKSSKLDSLLAKDIMTSNPVMVTSDTLAYDALQIMEKRQSQISVLPVVNHHQKSIGLIGLHDIIRSGL